MSRNDFLNQQREAVERMKEMNARSTFKGNDNRKNTQPFNPDMKGAVPKKAEPRCESGFFGIPALDGLLKDSDLVLIAGLILILANENVDKKLLFALIYILL